MRKKSTLNETLLREYVRSILVEDEYGMGAFDYTDPGPYVSRFGTSQDLYDAFVSPFVDVFKTAVGKTKEVAQATKTLLTVALQTVLTTLIPIYGYNYSTLFDEQEEKIEKIRNEYKDVYDRTESALNNSDAGMLAFMASPVLTSTYWIGKKSPSVIKGALSAVTGGESDDLFDTLKEKAIEAERWSLGNDDEFGGRSRSSSGKKKSPKDFYGESRLLEAEEQSKPKITPEKILKSNVFISRVSESPRLKEMQRVAIATYRETLTKIYSQAEDLLKKAKTVEDLEKIAKKPIKDIEKVKALQGPERAKAEKILIENVRKSMKEFYVKSLNDQVSSVLRVGIPEDSQYVLDFKAMIKKIQAL